MSVSIRFFVVCFINFFLLILIENRVGNASDSSDETVRKQSVQPIIISFNQLPRKVASIILNSLDVTDKRNALQVSKVWHSTVSDLKYLYYTLEYDTPICNYLEIIGAKIAHRKEIFGKGVKIAIIDSGWFDCNGDTNSVITQSTRARMHQIPSNQNDDCHHSNWVASIIAGKHGIAPQAQLEIFSEPSKKCKTDQDWNEWEKWCTNAIHQAITAKVDFINMSIGWREVGCNFPQTIATALYGARDAKIGVFISASNENIKLNSVTLGINMYKGIGTFLREMRGYARMIGGLDYCKDYGPPYNIQERYMKGSNDFSEECQDYGLMSPGKDILSFGINAEPAVWSGTSAATPMATAAAALVKSLTPYLDNAVILNILDQSARKTILNHITKDDYLNMDAKAAPQVSLKARYDREIGSSFRGRGGGAHKNTGSRKISFDEYVESEYQRDIKLKPHHFGQGVIYIPAALKRAEQYNNARPSGSFQ